MHESVISNEDVERRRQEKKEKQEMGLMVK